MPEKTSFYYENTLYCGICYADDAVRAAVSGDYNKLSEILDQHTNDPQEYQNLSETIFQLALIKNDDDLYDMLDRHAQTDLIISDHSLSERSEKYYMFFIKCCFDGTSYQIGSLLEKLIRQKMQSVSFDESFKGCSVLLSDPLYWLLVSGAYKKISGDIIKKSTECGLAHYPFISAVKNHDYDFVDILFKNGFCINAKIIADLICYPKSFSRLAGQFGKYFLSCSVIDTNDLTEITYAAGEEYLAEAAGLLYVSEHKYISDNIPDINAFPCRINKILSSDLKMFLDADKKLADIFAPELTLYIDELIDISAYEKIMYSKINYVITRNVCWNDPAAAADLISRSPGFESDETFAHSIIALLELRSEKLLVEMMKKSYINNDNIDDVLQYLSDTWQLDAISTINCFYNHV